MDGPDTRDLIQQIEITSDDCSPDLVDILSGLFSPHGTTGTGDDVILNSLQFPLVGHHSQVVPFQVVLGDVVHVYLVVGDQ